MAAKKRAKRATTRRTAATRTAATSRSGVVLRNAASDDLLDRFRGFVLKNSNVQDDLRNVRTATGVMRVARKYGFMLSEREVRTAVRTAEGALTTEQLGGLIGGAPCWCNKSVVNSKSCKKNVVDEEIA